MLLNQNEPPANKPIIIIGAGPVGMAAGAMLARHGLDVWVVEKNDRPTVHSKAIGVHARTLEGMNALGLTDELIAAGRPLSDVRLWERGKILFDTSFSSVPSRYSFVLALPQRDTERLLGAELRRAGGRVLWNTTLQSIDDVGDPDDPCAPVRVTLRGPDGVDRIFETPWLIGCDGGRSNVREMCGIDFPGGSYGRAFILGDVVLEWDGPRNELQFFLSPRGYLLAIPMPNGLHRIIAQTDKTYEDFQTGARPHATLEELQAVIDRNGPGGMRVHSPEWVTAAPFYFRMAATPRKGRVFLAGDSFHLYSPLGAQGLNTGFGDAFNLAWKLAMVEKGLAPVSLLDSYVTEREAVAQKIAWVTSRTTRFITATRPHERLLRRLGSRLLRNTARVRTLLPFLMAGMGQRYSPASPISASASDELASPGTRLPHATLRRDGVDTPLDRLAHGTRFLAILLTRRLEPAHPVRAQAWWEEARASLGEVLEPVIVAREIDGIAPGLVPILEDHLGELARQFQFGNEAFLLVRPDGFIATSADGWKFDRLDAYFAERRIGRVPGATAMRELDHVA